MFKSIGLTFSILFAAGIYAQQSCCAAHDASRDFALLSDDQQFVNAHLEPLPFTLGNAQGEMITFPCSGGNEGHGYEIKNPQSTQRWVFVIHEWWGLNDYIKKEAEKIYKELGNVNVLALDLYDTKVATTRDSAAKYMQATSTERAQQIIRGAMTRAGSSAQIATIGWCFGGGWSMQASLLAGKQNVACVIYYGMPEENLEKLRTLNAPVLMIWPEKDQWINKEVVEKFKKNMAAANKPLEVKAYPADHAFANPSNPKYEKVYAADAFTAAMQLMRKGFD